MKSIRVHHYFQLFARLVLAAGFLSAVADRFGLWGAPGASGVAWGTFSSFLQYTEKLNPWAPVVIIPALGWFVTVAEVLLAAWLLLGVRLRIAALASGVLLLLFGFGMALASSIKAPLDASVFAASAASFLLASTETKTAVRPN